MAVVLNKQAYQHAQRLIDAGRVVLDDRDAWSEHQPSTQQENKFIEEHGLKEYRKWYLGVDEEEDEANKDAISFRTAISSRSIAAGYSQPSRERGSTSTTT
jgi:hypothetical protein